MLSLLWENHKPLLAAVGGITLVRGLLPALLALTARGFINSASGILDGSGNGYSSLYLWLGLGFFVALAEALSTHTNNLIVARLSDQVSVQLTAAVLERASKKPLSYFERPAMRDVIERAKTGATERAGRFVTSAQAAVSQTFQTASLIAVLAYVEPLVLVIVGPVGLPFLFFQWRLSKKRHQIEVDRTENRRRTVYFTDLMTDPKAVAETKIFGIAPHLVGRFRDFIEDFKEQNWRLGLKNFTGYAVFSTATVITFYAVLFRVALRTVSGGATLGDLAIFGGAAIRLRLTLEGAIRFKTDVLEQVLYLRELREFLDGGGEEDPGPVPAGANDTGTLQGEIEFRHVNFTYPGSLEPVLADFSLHIHPGETLALVGRNGAGKSTFVKLLAGLYRPDGGVIFYDGQDARSLPAGRVRRSLSVVMQHFGMYETTAWENIAYGDWERLRDRPDLAREAAEQAGIGKMIDALPGGYDTKLGRSFGTTDLSLGQWQRLALARGFAKDASLLVLDEPTASLDARNELELYDRFSKMSRGRTAILISHRFSTISMADRIAVMDRGQIVEVGSHEELIKLNGQYAELYHLHVRWMQEGNFLE
jgi:ATP-binding cassette subfamily B protein